MLHKQLKTFFLLVLVYVIYVSAKKPDETTVIINAVKKYVAEWNYCFMGKYKNDNLIALFEKADKYPAPDNASEILIDINDVQIKYYTSLTILQKNDGEKNKIVPACEKESENGLYLSYPVFSADKKKAIVLVHTSCGEDCGSGELFVVKKTGADWTVVDRILKYRNKPKPALPK